MTAHTDGTRPRFSLEGRSVAVQGTLDRTPLPHLLVHGLTRGLTGSLVLGAGDGAALLVFANGAVVRVDVEDDASRLGQLLLAKKAIDDAGLEAGLARARETGTRLGEALLAEARIDATTLLAAREAQAERRVAQLAALPTDTAYAFVDGVDLVTEAAPDDAHAPDPLPLLAIAARATPDKARLESALAKIGDRALTLHAKATPDRFRFDPEESRVVEAIRGAPRPLAELHDGTVGSRDVVTAAAFVLIASHHVDVGSAPLGVPWPPPGRTSRPSRTSDEAADVERVLKASAAAEKSERFMLEGDVSSALPLAEEAVRLDPLNPEHLALCGYARGLAKPNEVGLRAGIQMLDDALAKSPRMDHALRYRGLLRRKLGDEREAIADFKAALEINPSNVDAARELRVQAGPEKPKPAAAQPTIETAPANLTGGPKRRRSPVLTALIVLLVGVGLWFGVPFVIAHLSRPPEAERAVRSHLVRNALDHALGPLHQGAFAHEEALDAMGPSAVDAAVKLLADTTTGADEEVKTNETYQAMANAWLLHYATKVAKADPPALATDLGSGAPAAKWRDAQAAWSDWASKHK
jgi:tetratricopeptide (TPR) repeat protein